MHELIAALSDPDDQPARAYAALERHVDRLIGVRLFTVTRFDPTADKVRRVYSNMPDAYPLAGEKPIGQDRWSDLVMRRGRTFVADTPVEFEDIFSDHELIVSLGCQSCLNLPVFVAGQFLGTLNCLNAAYHYTPERVTQAELLKLPAAAVFLMQDRLEGRG
ncbi:GAF domain-containing protein [Paracoccus sp. p4-l81]|uniref:GAF domain-containing protein n=1 Tax=unclassified Paracoccus (in: a-proteobacteria) TaxID=2688777 RepID=UPI0035B76CC7